MSPPEVFSLEPLKTEDLARLPLATLLFFIAFMAFIAFIAFMAAMMTSLGQLRGCEYFRTALGQSSRRDSTFKNQKSQRHSMAE